MIEYKDIFMAVATVVDRLLNHMTLDMLPDTVRYHRLLLDDKNFKSTFIILTQIIVLIK